MAPAPALAPAPSPGGALSPKPPGCPAPLGTTSLPAPQDHSPRVADRGAGRGGSLPPTCGLCCWDPPFILQQTPGDTGGLGAWAVGLSTWRGEGSTQPPTPGPRPGQRRAGHPHAGMYGAWGPPLHTHPNPSTPRSDSAGGWCQRYGPAFTETSREKLLRHLGAPGSVRVGHGGGSPLPDTDRGGRAAGQEGLTG